MADNSLPMLFKRDGTEIAVQLDSPANTVWATALDIANLFGCTSRNVESHIKNIYDDGELEELSTAKLFFVVRQEGQRAVERAINHYNLDVILSVGYRINSRIATEFRKWSSSKLKEYLVQGYTIDEEKIKNDPVALEALSKRIRSIRLSEKSMYRRVCDVFMHASSDYDKTSQLARTFFAMAQDKFHYAVTGRTAAEIILERAKSSKPNMGLVNFEGREPHLSDARIGKNYLEEEELKALENICEQFMLFAESKTFRKQKMTMEELSFKLNTLLTANDYPVLYQYDSFKRGAADSHAKRQLAEYQTRLTMERNKAIADMSSGRERSSKRGKA